MTPELTPEPHTVTPELAPEPHTVTPELAPEPHTVTPESAPEPHTVTPELAPEPRTVTPESALPQRASEVLHLLPPHSRAGSGTSGVGGDRKQRGKRGHPPLDGPARLRELAQDTGPPANRRSWRRRVRSRSASENAGPGPARVTERR